MATCPRCQVHYGEGVGQCPDDGESLLVDVDELAEEPDLACGEMVGEYRVEGKLGEGGCGVVFRAIQPVIGKQVAIKLLHRKSSADPDMVRRFVAEARSVNQIRHQHIIDIFSFGQLADGRHYFVMELLSGVPLDAHLERRGRLGLDETIRIMRPIARALDAAHAKGVAHRDLKPENIFLGIDAEGRPFPKLLDFGIAKLLGDGDERHKTQTGLAYGTPGYMAPEQCRGRDVDHRADIYAFGVVCYHLLTGRLPFRGEDHLEVFMKHLSEEPQPPSQLVPELPAHVDLAILCMMAKDPAGRPATLVAAVEALAGRPLEHTPLPDGIRHVMVGAEGPAEGESLTLGVASTIAAKPSAVRRSKLGPRGRRDLWIGGPLAAVIGALIVVLWRGMHHEQPAAPGPTAVTATAQAAAAPAAPAPSSPPARVALVVEGTPSLTQVYGPDGTWLGVAPATILVPRGETPIPLRFEKEGYSPVVRMVMPTNDERLEITMTPISRAQPTKLSAPPPPPRRKAEKAPASAKPDTYGIGHL